MPLGTNRVCHMAFITKDIEKFVNNWAKLLGIEKPKIWKIPPKEVAPAATFGKLEEYENCLISVIQFDNITMEVVQPGEEPSPWKLYLDKYGEGFQHISFIVEDPGKAREAIKELGVDSFYHAGYYPGNTYTFYDTRDVLGMEINLKYDEDNRAQVEELMKQAKQ